MKKLNYVDALRGFAILGVIMIHSSQFGGLNVPAFFEKIILHGNRGVQLFYLASAFTLFLSFKNRQGTELHPTRNFFLRRFFRIAPVYYLGICYYLFQHGLEPVSAAAETTPVSALNVVSNFTFLHGFSPYWISSLVPGGWSIAVEMTFYLFLPFLFLRIKNINHAAWLFVISIIARLLLQVLFTRYPLIADAKLWEEYLFFYFPSQLPIFALGIIMYFLVAEKADNDKFPAKPLLALSGLVLIQLTTGIDFLPGHILFGIAFLVLGISLSRYQPLLLVNPIISYIGKISFSLYIVHFGVLYWLTRFHLVNYTANGTLNYIVRFSIVLAVSALISSILFKLVEVPFQQLCKKIIQRLEKKEELEKLVL